MSVDIKSFVLSFIIGLILSVCVFKALNYYDIVTFQIKFIIYFMLGWMTPDVLRLIIKKVRK